MHKKSSDKKNSSQGERELKTYSVSSEGLHRKVSDTQHNSTVVRESKPEFYCMPIKESDRQKFVTRMSPESIKISNGTKWSENGFIPSFKSTDDILMKAARRTYKTHGTNHR